MRLIDFAKRRPDGLIDHDWIEGFEAHKMLVALESCPYESGTDEFKSWVEGWTYAANYLGQENISHPKRRTQRPGSEETANLSSS
jgi:hypothetical protein